MTAFTINNIEYTMNANGYCYKVEGGKKSRISKAVFDEALEQNIAQQAEEAAIEDAKADMAYEARVAKQEADDKATEDAFNGKKPASEKKAKKPAKRAKKNVAYEIEFNGEKVTLTEKQKIFFENIPNDQFYDGNGEDCSLWTDAFCDTLAEVMNSMVVGAIISTLREKNIIVVGQGKANGKKCKFFELTELGKAIFRDMGLE
jgi:hypothetical protein